MKADNTSPYKHERSIKEDDDGFCSTRFSRRGKDPRFDYFGPFDEGNTFYNDLNLFMERQQYKTTYPGHMEEFYNKLACDIQMIYDTYFTTASLLSLLVIDESTGRMDAYNAETYFNAERTVDDWAVTDSESIGHVIISPENRGTDFIFPQTMTRVNPYFFGKDGVRQSEKEFKDTIKNWRLIFKDAPEDINSARGKEMQVWSAIIKPLWVNVSLTGAIMAGCNMTNCYTNFMTDILPYSLLHFWGMLTECIGLVLKQARD